MAKTILESDLAHGEALQQGQPLKRVFVSSRCAQTILSQRISLARYAAAQGWAVELGGDATPGDYAALLEREGFAFHPLPVEQRSLNPLKLVGLIAAYVRALRQSKPDVFHAFTIKPVICGLIGAKLAGVPTRIATVPGLGHAFLAPSKVKRFVVTTLYRISFLFADLVIFYNQDDREEFVRRRLLVRDKTRIVPGSGIDTAQFPLTAMPEGDTTQFVFVGRLLNEKGVPELLAAMRLVRAQGINAKLHVVGDCDPNNPSSLSKEEVDTAVSQGLFTWHGMVGDVRPLVAAAHVVVLPSHREGIPLALLEGGSLGRALISTDVPGCREVVRHNISGLLVPCGDVAALAAAIAELASDRDLVSAMGMAASADVSQRFATGVVNATVLSYYEADRRRLPA